MPKCPRIAPKVDFPPYTYIPGLTPHPTSDPAGHSFGAAPLRPAWPLDHWRQSCEHCRAIDLFNHGYYWEAHEVWEGLWHAAGRRGAVANVFQGLIKLSAAGVKTLGGSLEGRRRHARRAAELFEQARNSPDVDLHGLRRSLGLDLEQLATWARGVAASDAAASDALVCQPGENAPPGPRRVFSFLLIPDVDVGTRRPTRR